MGVPSFFKYCQFGPFDPKTYPHKRLAVDMYVILHKFVMDEQIAKTLTLNDATYIPEYYEQVKTYLQNFIDYGFELYLVYDGGEMKYKVTESDRAQRRLACYLNQQWIGAVEITPNQMFNFQDYLSKHPFEKDGKPITVPYVVAPFEADAQLAYLCKQGITDAVLTNDSDLIIYGVKHILMIRQKAIETYDIMAENPGIAASINEISPEKLWMFGFLIGCDYFTGVSGIGIVKAMRIVTELEYASSGKGIDWEVAWNRMNLNTTFARAVKSAKKVGVDYKQSFDLVRMVYTSQPVIDPRDFKLKYLTGADVPAAQQTAFGTLFDVEQHAKGVINPFGGKKFEISN